jgi:hypothetical protein
MKSENLKKISKKSSLIKKRLRMLKDLKESKMIISLLDELILIATSSEEEGEKTLEHTLNINKIMESVDDPVRTNVKASLTCICESLTFHDINYQRIDKIVNLVEKMINSSDLFKNAPKKEDVQTNDPLLNGPQNTRYGKKQKFADTFFGG